MFSRRHLLRPLLGLAPGLALLSGVSACRPVDVLNTLTPGTGYRPEAGIAYGALPRQQLDIYQPTAPHSEPAPVIVFFYGGSWNSGDRADYRFVGQQLAALGYTVVIPDYRLYPDVRFPAFIADGAAALRWAQDHIAQHGGDPSRIFLMGHSAGAYNAMMLALDRNFMARAGVDRTHIRGVVGLAGPYDFKIEGDLLPGIFGAADPATVMPVAFADQPAPPVLLVTGDADTTVLPANSRRLAAALRRGGNPVRVLEYAGFDHKDVILQLSQFWSPTSDARDAIVRFLDAPLVMVQGGDRLPTPQSAENRCLTGDAASKPCRDQTSE
jgi:acetyl esterase/lipase